MRYASTYHKSNNNEIINNQNLYLNGILKNDNSKDKKVSLINKIKSLSKMDSYNINNNNKDNNKFNIYDKNLKLKINKSYSLSNYNYNNINFLSRNTVYTPLPYKSFFLGIT